MTFIQRRDSIVAVIDEAHRRLRELFESELQMYVDASTVDCLYLDPEQGAIAADENGDGQFVDFGEEGLSDEANHLIANVMHVCECVGWDYLGLVYVNDEVYVQRTEVCDVQVS